MLRRESDGSYWLVTPAERGRVEVEDAPFIAVAVDREGEGNGQNLIFRTNLDEIVTAGAGAPAARRDRRRRHAVALYPGAARAGGAAGRPVFYEVVDRGEEVPGDGETRLGVWSGGMFFDLGILDELDAD